MVIMIFINLLIKKDHRDFALVVIHIIIIVIVTVVFASIKVCECNLDLSDAHIH